MLTQLSTVKARLSIDDFEVKYDVLLTNAINAYSAQFDKECNREFARTVGATEEFDADETEILAACYPIEAITKFELKSNETDGWLEQTGINYLLRRNCVISLANPLGDCRQRARITYTGGYVSPGDTVGAGQTALPDDLEQAAVEQVACWFSNRDKLGLVRRWPKGGVYEEYAQTELLINVKEVLRKYERWKI
jgi:hypothetical protein